MTSTFEHIVGVHVVNPEDIGKTPDIEVSRPEHFTASTFTPPLGEVIGTGLAAAEPTRILNLDPLRDRARLSFSGNGQIILAASEQQAQSLAQNIQQAADEGCLITSPGTFDVKGTAALWAALVPGTTGGTPVGTAAAGGIGSGTGGSATLPAGATLTGFTVTFAAATTAAGVVAITNVPGGPLNYNIPVGTTTYTITGLSLPATGGAPTVTVSATAGVGPGTVIAYGTTSTPTVNSVSIGVLQERRDR